MNTLSKVKSNWTEEFQFQSPIVAGKRFVKALFYGCKLRNVRGTVFQNCCMRGSALEPQRVEEMLGLTVTLDCFTFDGVLLNSLAFDSILNLLAMTKGNDEKREMLKRMISENNRKQIDDATERLQRVCGN